MGLINTDDPLWPRVSAAILGTRPHAMRGKMPDEDVALAYAVSLFKNIVSQYEAEEAIKPPRAAADAARAKVEADFSALIPTPEDKA